MLKRLGDLKQKTKSFGDLVASARHRREWLLEQTGDKLYDYLVERMMESISGGVKLPPDVEAMVKDEGKFFLVCLEAALLSSPAGKLLRRSIAAQTIAGLAAKVPSMEKALIALGQNGLYTPIKQLLLVAKANILTLDHTSMRIVDRELTPYQAKSQCLWAGTFAEYRMGSILTGPADANGHFAIYFPSERRNLRGDSLVTRVSTDYQTTLA